MFDIDLADEQIPFYVQAFEKFPIPGLEDDWTCHGSEEESTAFPEVGPSERQDGIILNPK